MSRDAKVRWIDKVKAWRSDVGPRSPKSGRRMPVYFRRGEDGSQLSNNKASERAARRLLEKYLDARDEHEFFGNLGLADPTVEQLRLLWLSHVKRSGTKETHQVCRSAIGQFCAFAHQGTVYRDRRASTLTTTDVTRFLNAKQAQRRKPNYLAKLAGVVQAMLNWAADPQADRNPERLLPAGNPIRGMKAPTVPDSPERFADVKTLATFLRGWWRLTRTKKSKGRMRRYDRLTVLLIRCLIQTGARPGELCKAEWGDVDWEAARTSAGHPFGRITLPPERWKAGKKTGKSRTVYLTPTLTRALRREFGRPDRHPTHLFWHVRRREGVGDSEPWTSAALGARTRKVRRKLGAEDEGPNRIVNYLFRHTAASRGLMRGLDPVTVAALLGTSPAMLAKHYGHILNSHLAGAAETLAGARRPKQSGGK